MHASRSWLAAHIGRWLDRWASSLVMEAECDDGTRLLIGLDPGFHGALPVAVSPDAAERPLRWPGDVVVPDDLRDLVP
jgi:hypothetical protein